jgi:hypothetical protein
MTFPAFTATPAHGGNAEKVIDDGFQRSAGMRKVEVVMGRTEVEFQNLGGRPLKIFKIGKW